MSVCVLSMFIWFTLGFTGKIAPLCNDHCRYYTVLGHALQNKIQKFWFKSQSWQKPSEALFQNGMVD